MSGLRIGMGYDVHAFAEGRPLVLGGVEIPHDRGLLGHSDADVLAHALMDAILGALREGDIGRLFPDDDPAYAGADSLELLRRVAELARERGFPRRRRRQRPRPAATEGRAASRAMRKRIAEALGSRVDAVGVKATTTEGLGFAGREEGVAAQAVVLLERV